MLPGVLLAVGVWLVGAIYFFWKVNAQNEGGGLIDGNVDLPLTIEARGSDRAWRFVYAGPDGIHGSADDSRSVADLRLPVGAQVLINLRSEDFIYVFSCPGLKLKEIAVPDLEFSISFQVERVGEYELLMDPMCGFRLPPGKTMGTIRVVSERDFRRWRQGQRD